MTAPETPVAVAVRRAADRFHTRLAWLDSWHSFSFGPHHDPDNTHHGLLLVSNDDRVAPGGGFGDHAHRDMEIVTWVLDGALEHRDSTGAHGVITPGVAQRMTAGAGVVHSERNASSTAPVHFVQMWVPPDQRGLDPGYEERDLRDLLAGGELVPVASGRGHRDAVALHQRAAVLWAGRLAADTVVTLPDDRHVHAYVARGALDLEGAGTLLTGDAARLTDAGARAATAGPEGAELLVWSTA
jgi:redox-sensitive bicupin YhaK (pirin superfamily)